MSKERRFETYHNYPSGDLDHIFIGIFDTTEDRWDGIFSIEKDDDDDLVIVIPDDSWHILSSFTDLSNELSADKDAGVECDWEEILYILKALGIEEHSEL